MTHYIVRHQEGGYLYKRGDGSWARTPQLAKASLFAYEKAKNVLNNCLSAPMRKHWEIIEAPETSEVSSLVLPQENYSYDHFDWGDISKKQYELFNDLEQYGNQLRYQLSEVDLEICDINHYIEFFSLDAAKGYKAYRMLKERLLRRRKIKDELAKTNIFVASTSGDFSSGKVDHQIKAFDKRQYTPRVLGELFGIETN